MSDDDVKPCPSCRRPLTEVYHGIRVCERDHAWEGAWPMSRLGEPAASLACALRDRRAEPPAPPDVSRLLAAASGALRMLDWHHGDLGHHPEGCGCAICGARSNLRAAIAERERAGGG